jgi:hypothetical protein
MEAETSLARILIGPDSVMKCEVNILFMWL